MSANDMTQTRLMAGQAVCGWIGAHHGDAGHTLLFMPMDNFLEFPEEVQEWGEQRSQQRPTSVPTIAVPARILAMYALGYTLPKREPGNTYHYLERDTS